MAYLGMPYILQASCCVHITCILLLWVVGWGLVSARLCLPRSCCLLCEAEVMWRPSCESQVPCLPKHVSSCMLHGCVVWCVLCPLCACAVGRSCLVDGVSSVRQEKPQVRLQPVVLSCRVLAVVLLVCLLGLPALPCLPAYSACPAAEDEGLAGGPSVGCLQVSVPLLRAALCCCLPCAAAAQVQGVHSPACSGFLALLTP